MTSRRTIRVFSLIWVACFGSTSCLVHRRTVAPPGKHQNAPLLKATKDELLQRIHSASDFLQSFTMKVTMSPSVGSLYGGQVTDYASITGFILFQRPDNIRVIGQDPVVHSTVFDMVSTGNMFHVSIPLKSQFYIGQNDAPANSKNKLENLRPVAFLNALLINPATPDEITVVEDDTNETRANYILMFIRRDGDVYRLVRNIHFDRHTLLISRQKTFDANGEITSDTTYSDWKAWSGVIFPSAIDMQRPQDGYEVQLTVIDMKLNPPDMSAAKFVLNQPPGSQLHELK